jgi:single-stranded DNA-binding protein
MDTTYWQVCCFGAQAEHVTPRCTAAPAIAVGAVRAQTWSSAEGEDQSTLEIVAPTLITG